MLNRTLTPELKEIDQIDFVSPTIHNIHGNTRLFHMAEVPNNTSRLDLYFDAGSARGERAIAGFVNGMLLSGSEKLSAIEIQSQIDALGGFYEAGISQETAVVSIYALKDHLLDIFKIIANALEELSFTEKEMKEMINDKRQKFKVSMEKVSFLAQREFQQRLFHNSIYGRVSDETDFEMVNRDKLVSFFNEHYLHGLTKVVVVGSISDSEINEISTLAAKWAKPSDNIYEKDLQNKNGVSYFPKEGALQTALRLGRILFNKTHEDYLDFLVLNTIIGDYFGSRLMSNIREDKGYTYGIGSMVAELHQSGYFLIATEVGKDVKDAAMDEIRKELTRLQEELVSEEELTLVKNYMLGQLLKSADGPYSMADLFLSVEPYGLDLDFYNKAIESLHEITAARIQQLAKRYLNWDELTVVAAG
jgi:predicted Zn-dependent peptidase